MINEHSNITADGPPIYPFKTVIPGRGRGPALQGVVEISAASICLREGDWPSREEDVEEVDVDKLKKMVHVKDEDIEKLDALVVKQERGDEMRKEVWFGLSIMAMVVIRVRVPAARLADHQRPPRAC